MNHIKLEESWKTHLASEFNKDYMIKLKNFLSSQKKAGKVIYPKGEEYFNAFKYTPFGNVKLVIIGQDPYPGANQAHGLCFSVKLGIALPASLKNIFTELKNDVGFNFVDHGCLVPWTKQGVLLINSVLTVEKSRRASHANKGWEEFTDVVIQKLNQNTESLVFFLWGSYAKKKGVVIDREKHLVLESVHPSPLSAYNGFFGNNFFSKANEYLITKNKSPIDWQLPLAKNIQY